MTSILGSGDPAFYHSDRDQAQAEHDLQIKYEDSIFADGRPPGGRVTRIPGVNRTNNNVVKRVIHQFIFYKGYTFFYGG